MHLGDLQPWDKNPRKISRQQAKRLADSFDHFGQVETIAISPTNEVYDGHQRLSVLLAQHGSGYIVEARRSSRHLTDEERKMLVVYLHQGAVGSWDFEKLMADFNFDSLSAWGFDSNQLNKVAKFASPADSFRGIPDFQPIGTPRQRWAFKDDYGFFAIRSFITQAKKAEMEQLKSWKSSQPAQAIDFIADEIAQALIKTFTQLAAFTVTSAPIHKTGFAQAIARKAAELLGCPYEELFFTKTETSTIRNIFRNRGEITTRETETPQLLWIDDTLTSGYTLRSCKQLAKSKTFLAVVWIYDDILQGSAA